MKSTESKMKRQDDDKDSFRIHLSRGQIAEIKRRISDREPFATDAEVRRTFARLTKSRKRS
jgi:hypothetical protein